MQVYWVRKLHQAAHLAGLDIGRKQTRRLMKLAGILGVAKDQTVTTVREWSAIPGVSRHPADALVWRFAPPHAAMLSSRPRDDCVPGLSRMEAEAPNTGVSVLGSTLWSWPIE